MSGAQPKGLPVINMSFNELPFGPSPAVSAAIDAVTTKANFYGNPSCQALREEIGQCNGLDPEAIVCGNGSEELLDVIARNFVRYDDEIVISEFGYIQFAIIANRLAARLVKVPEIEFTTDVEGLLSAITAKTKLVFLANPNNPTATMMPEKDVVQLAEKMPKDVVLVIDLAYGEFTGFDYCARVHDLVRRFENVVVARTFSKAYGLAGLRVGWCHAPDWMIPRLYAARGMGSVNAVAQAAALVSLREPDLVNARIAQIIAERDRVASELSELGLSCLPSQTNFMLTMLADGDPEQAEALVAHLFDDAGIVVNRTREKGLERYIRFSLSLPEHNTALVQSVKRFLR
ncbi:histidinol-phosphate transaminase [Pelagibius sp. Alg239-R121]|uniref:pyridoxal phosphate-dependent aminotransferase n=1 Tax=Pelagibius sp. Alg239-R121 TaxID=2993448 RepID=UPI0024A6E9F0|nr:histidinol-phosphate transaminase [Pelagibius sp. Alg239-R121]